MTNLKGFLKATFVAAAVALPAMACVSAQPAHASAAAGGAVAVMRSYENSHDHKNSQKDALVGGAVALAGVGVFWYCMGRGRGGPF